MEFTTANIELALYLKKENARVLRSAVEGIAKCVKFSRQQIEDIKLAVEETFILAMEADSEGKIHFSFDVEPNGLNIQVINAYLASLNKVSKKSYSVALINDVVDRIDVIPRNKNYYDLQLVKKLY